MVFKEKLEKALKKAVGEEVKVEIPRESSMGDFAFPCFGLAKKKKQPPAQIANDIQKKIKLDFIRKVEVKGAYLNFFIKKEGLIKDTLKNIQKQKKKYGQSDIGKKKKVMVEYSGPNTNKPLHVGHLKNQAIGMSIAKILEATGHKVIKKNIISDRGIHICKSMLAYQKWGKGEKPHIKSDHFVGHWYVTYDKRKDDNLEKEIREMLLKWEAGDKETRELWKKMNTWAIDGMKETYKEFGSRFDVWMYESEYYNKAKPIIEEGLKKKVFKKDEEGRIIAQLEKYGLPDKTVLRSDGTSIYITNDLAMTKAQFDKYKLDKAIWVVASEQKTYFEQLFKIFELIGYSFASKTHHMSYGMVNLKEGKMKSREGNVVDADDLMEKIRILAEQETKQRNSKLKPKELYLRSKKISLGAIKFYLLKTDAGRDMIFDVQNSIAFDGETGPYVQYSVARSNSILKRGKGSKNIDYTLLKSGGSYRLVKKLAQYPEVVAQASEQLRPHLVANYLLDLAQLFNNFYHKDKVIQEDQKLQKARVTLVGAVKQVIENGLSLLDIESMDEM